MFSKAGKIQIPQHLRMHPVIQCDQLIVIGIENDGKTYRRVHIIILRSHPTSYIRHCGCPRWTWTGRRRHFDGQLRTQPSRALPSPHAITAPLPHTIRPLRPPPIWDPRGLIPRLFTWCSWQALLRGLRNNAHVTVSNLLPTHRTVNKRTSVTPICGRCGRETHARRMWRVPSRSRGCATRVFHPCDYMWTVSRKRRGLSLARHEINMTCKLSSKVLFTRDEKSCYASSQARQECGDKVALPWAKNAVYSKRSSVSGTPSRGRDAPNFGCRGR